MNELKARIADNLKRLRTEKDYSMEYLADKLGRNSYMAYSRLERGETDLKVEDAIKLADIYKIPVNEIINPDQVAQRNIVSEPSHPYGKKNSLNLNVILDGREDTLQKHIEMLTKVNGILAES